MQTTRHDGRRPGGTAPPDPVTPQNMRHVLGGVPTGIVVVAAEVEGEIVGLSANSFTSVSLDPPLVSISFGHTSTSWPLLHRAPRWGISVLGERQTHVLQELRRPSHERFGAIDMNLDAGAAFVVGALATLTVELDTEVEAGDHASPCCGSSTSVATSSSVPSSSLTATPTNSAAERCWLTG